MAAALLSAVAILLPVMPATAWAAPRAESRDADMDFLEYLGTFEAEGADAMDPLVRETLENEKAKKGKPVKKKRRLPADEKPSAKDTSDE